METSKRILVVDDEDRNLRLLRAMLKTLGYESCSARDGHEALVLLREEFDLVLLDVMMPGMDGFEVARRIRQDPEHGAVPIIMVTVLTGKQDRLAAAEAGANDFISKPIDKVELRVRVASLLKMKEAQDAIKRHRTELEATVAARTVLLSASESRLRAIFEAAQDCIFVQDRDLQYTHVNPSMAFLFRRSPDELIGLTDRDLFGADAARHSLEVGARVLLGETVEEERTKLVNGIPTTFHEIRVPIRDGSGQITGLCGIARNITDRKILQTPRALAAEQYASPAMRLTLDRALLVADSDSIILLTGESGSGKDYLARFIHEHSHRADGPFFTVNCAAVSPELAESELFGHEPGAFTGANRRKRGLFELAEGGTLLLNEIGELSLGLQAKLLTFLDTMSFTRVGGEKNVSVNARLIAATNRDLDREVADGRFRRDLFYRLNVYSIVVPPLRERIEDIAILARQVLAELAADLQLERVPTIDSASMDRLIRYDWPGNARELRNVLERSLILSRSGPFKVDLGQADGSIPGGWSWTATFPPERPLSEMARDLKRCLIKEALDRSRGKKVEAARLLKVSRDVLKRQMKTLDLTHDDD